MQVGDRERNWAMWMNAALDGDEAAYRRLLGDLAPVLRANARRALARTPMAAIDAAFILPILMVQDIVGVWAFRRDYSAENLKYLFPGGLFGLFLGWAFARTVSDGALLLIVGLILNLVPIGGSRRRVF